MVIGRHALAALLLLAPAACSGVLDLQELTYGAPPPAFDGGAGPEAAASTPVVDAGSSDAHSSPPSDGSVEAYGDAHGVVVGAGCGCPAPPCVLASGIGSPGNLAFDDRYVYFADMGTPLSASGTITRVRFDGTGGDTLVQSLGYPASIAVAGGALYWFDTLYGSAAVQTLDLQTRALTTLTSTNGGWQMVVVVAGATIYWTQDSIAPSQRGAVFQCSPSQGACMGGVVSLFTGDDDPHFIATAGVNPLDPVYFNAIKPSGEVVVYARPAGAPDGGGAQIVASGETVAGPMVVGPHGVYWANERGVATCPLAGCGGKKAPQAIDGRANVSSVALDGDVLYWIEGNASTNRGAIMKANLDGSHVATVAANQDSPAQLAVTSTGVFWVSQGFGGDASDADGGGMASVMCRGK